MKITTDLDYQVILANQARPVHFAMRFEAACLGQARPRPAGFCLVLDRSGSMLGPPLEKAKQAALLAARNLRPADLFSLVVFNDEAQVLLPLQPAIHKESFLRAIGSIQSGGNTNLTGGWSLGRDELKNAPDGTARRLLLLSDGLLNRGIIDPAVVRQTVAAGLENQNIRTSCLGFGTNYNEDLMTGLAQATGGQFYDADSAETFPAIFESELDGLQKITVQNLRVRLRRLDFCERVQSLGLYPQVERSEGWVEYSLGDLVSEESRVACFALDVLPLPWVAGRPVASLEGERLLEVEVLYDEVGEAQIASSTFTQIVRIQATQNPDEVEQKWEVIPLVALQRAGQVIDTVTQLMDLGDVPAALGALRAAMDALKAYGPGANVSEGLQQLEAMLGRIESGVWSLRERKMSKYRSHSYRRMSSSEHWSGSEPPPGFKHRPPPRSPTAPPPPGGNT